MQTIIVVSFLGLLELCGCELEDGNSAEGLGQLVLVEDVPLPDSVQVTEPRHVSLIETSVVSERGRERAPGTMSWQLSTVSSSAY